MKVIGVVGMPGSGKTTIANIAKNMGIRVVSMGDVVREWAAHAGMAMDDKSVGGFANDERRKFGNDIWAKRTIEKLIDDKGSDNVILIEGIRSIWEVNTFRKYLGNNFTLIAVICPPRVRFERIRRRKRDDSPRNYDEFLERDRREEGWGILEAVKKADIQIENTGSLEDFISSVENILKGIVSD